MGVQGYTCGTVTLTPLAAVGLCTVNRSGSLALGRHAAAVTALASHQISTGFGGVQHVLLSGFADGQVLAWDVASRELMMRLHVHAAAVRLPLSSLG